MIAKGGDRLLEESAVTALKSELLRSRARRDAQHPRGGSAGGHVDSFARRHAPRPAERIRRARAPASYSSKGGHAEGDESIDVAVTAGGSFEVRGPRLPGRHTHGTGLHAVVGDRRQPGVGTRRTSRRSVPRGSISKARSGTRRRSAAGMVPSTMAGGSIPDATAPRLEDGSRGSARGAGIHRRLYWQDGGKRHASPSETAGRLAPFRVTSEPLDARADRRGRRVAASAERWRRSSAWCATTTSVGQVRWLDYECYEPLAVSSLERIAAEAAAEWPGARLAIAHRIGSLRNR